MEAVTSNLKVASLRNSMLKLIEMALDKRLRNQNGEVVALPTCPENYISFLDLTEILAHSDRKTWHAFVLQDQTDSLENLHEPNGELPLFKIRKGMGP